MQIHREHRVEGGDSKEQDKKVFIAREAGCRHVLVFPMQPLLHVLRVSRERAQRSNFPPEAHELPLHTFLGMAKQD